MNIEELIAEKQEELGIHQFGFLDVDKVSFNEWVRTLCEKNSCGHYGKKWVCPPAVGTYEECRDKILKFKRAFVYTTKHDLEDSFDFEGMVAGREVHDEYSTNIVNFFKENVEGDKLVLSGDGCTKCKTCTYPDAPCRFPEKTFSSVEAFGVEVNRLAAAAGVNYINGANTVTYFGCIFY